MHIHYSTLYLFNSQNFTADLSHLYLILSSPLYIQVLKHFIGSLCFLQQSKFLSILSFSFLRFSRCDHSSDIVTKEKSRDYIDKLPVNNLKQKCVGKHLVKIQVVRCWYNSSHSLAKKEKWNCRHFLSLSGISKCLRIMDGAIIGGGNGLPIIFLFIFKYYYMYVY